MSDSIGFFRVFQLQQAVSVSFCHLLHLPQHHLVRKSKTTRDLSFLHVLTRSCLDVTALNVVTMRILQGKGAPMRCTAQSAVSAVQFTLDSVGFAHSQIKAFHVGKYDLPPANMLTNIHKDPQRSALFEICFSCCWLWLIVARAPAERHSPCETRSWCPWHQGKARTASCACLKNTDAYCKNM